MLGRKRKRLREISFSIDLIAGPLLIGGIYLLLQHYNAAWGALLYRITGHPFHINGVDHLQEQRFLILLIPFGTIAAQKLLRFYELDFFSRWRDVVWASFRTVAAGAACSALFYYLLGVSNVNRSLLLGFSFVYFIYQIVKEGWLRHWLKRHGTVEALLVATAEDATRRLESLDGIPTAIGVKAVWVTDGQLLPQRFQHLVISHDSSVSETLLGDRYDLVMVGETTDSVIVERLMAAAEEKGVDVWYFSRVPLPSVSTQLLDEFRGQPVLVFKTASRYEARLAAKRSFDIVVSLVLLIVLFPFLLLVGAAIKVTSRGPMFFVQERTGWRGRTFRMYKFRTMRADAETQRAAVLERNQMLGPVFKATDDPRITPLGRILRRYSIDELPQLLNVLQGHMSLVGPRPLPSYETAKFSAFRDYRRYSVLPGMTGLWQVSGRNAITDFNEWVKLDLAYIDQWSLALDIRILLKTIPAVLKGQGAA